MIVYLLFSGHVNRRWLSIGPLRKYFYEILIKIEQFHWRIYFEMCFQWNINHRVPCVKELWIWTCRVQIGDLVSASMYWPGSHFINVFSQFEFHWNFVSMMTSSNGNIFRVTGHLCGEFTCPRWIPHTKASDAGFDVFFDLHLNKRLSKQSRGWWFETPSRSLWRQRNAL